jgi:hypothetical protein
LRAPRADDPFTPLDKLRLVLVFYLSAAGNTLSKDDIAELEKELKAAGANVAAFEYVRRTREITRMASSNVGGSSTPVLGGGGQGGELFKGFSALGNRVSALLYFLRPGLISVNLTAHGPPEGRWAGKPHFRRQKLLAHKQTTPRHSPDRSAHGLFLSLQPVAARNR